jgi:catechol 2,3-dioxygenase-like lactoylglutathione lyase family enzyme
MRLRGHPRHRAGARYPVVTVSQVEEEDPMTTPPTRPRWAQVVVDTTDARATAEFWRQLLGLVYRPGHGPPPAGEPDPAGSDWLNLFDPDGTPRLAFQQVSSLAPTTWPDHDVPQQLHLDLTVDSVAELEAVHDRVLALGGQLRSDRSDDPEEPLRVYVDPAGHTFCVFVA